MKGILFLFLLAASVCQQSVSASLCAFVRSPVSSRCVRGNVLGRKERLQSLARPLKEEASVSVQRFDPFPVASQFKDSTSRRDKQVLLLLACVGALLFLPGLAHATIKTPVIDPSSEIGMRTVLYPSPEAPIDDFEVLLDEDWIAAFQKLKEAKNEQEIFDALGKIQDWLDDTILRRQVLESDLIKPLIRDLFSVKRQWGDNKDVWTDGVSAVYRRIRKIMDPIASVPAEPYLKVFPWLVGIYYPALAVALENKKYEKWFPSAYFGCVFGLLSPILFYFYTS
uniref:Uncharacterized protein n=1 Tax=Chromera velia CCMP2878 TaxID=1169474 RepID=A0A0G4HGB8_9ALVE|eukprot:Cvel_27190.t1-p1 / transcript=Cvel_27190.t1 / gene=Cvel_27190 / organism=Chromera_velia_CCMP2878 / gene_product=hypothetical protein / transcript_product=hypothetical protein / location=Cvel_scaffold3357:1130-3718(-) / protein_length=281 / sequence_SO=supercontig / SO=protein_coding / is_pseudo=false